MNRFSRVFLAHLCLAMVSFFSVDAYASGPIVPMPVLTGDVTPPVALCKSDTVYLDATGKAFVDVTLVDNGSFDDTMIDTMFLDLDTAYCNNLGLPGIESQDQSAFNSTFALACPSFYWQSFTVGANGFLTKVQVFDTTASGAILEIYSGTGVGGTLVHTQPITTTGGIVTFSLSAPIPVAIGEVYTFQVLSTGAEHRPFFHNVNLYPGGHCSINGLVGSFMQFDLYFATFVSTSVGGLNVTLTVTDTCGNSSTCQSGLAVFDTLGPTIVCPSDTYYVDTLGNLTIPFDEFTAGVFDNCGLDSLTMSDSVYTCADTGTVTIDIYAEDGQGLADSCTATVTVADSTAPQAVCMDITATLDGAGTAALTGASIDAGSSDNCSIASLDVSVSSLACGDVGTASVVLTVTDVSGNASNCTASVSVEDNAAPTALCNDFTVVLDGAGMASIVVGDIDAGSADNCSIGSTSLSQTDFTCSDVGTASVSLSVTDASANVGSCTANVEVQDAVPPTAACGSATVFLDAAGVGLLDPADINSGSTDNCNVASLSASPSTFSCGDLGANTVTLTVFDDGGLSSTCSASVTVVDGAAPTMVCSDITVALDITGFASIVASDVDGGTSDNCGTPSTFIDIMFFSCADTGANTVTLTGLDAFSNSAFCTSTVTVQDTIPPTMICNDVSVFLDAGGSASVTTTDLESVSFDNCGSVALSVSGAGTVNCGDIGTVTAYLVGEDASGNRDSCGFYGNCYRFTCSRC